MRNGSVVGIREPQLHQTAHAYSETLPLPPEEDDRAEEETAPRRRTNQEIGNSATDGEGR